MPPAPASTFTVTNLDVAMARSWTLSAVGPVDHGGTERISGILRGMATLGPDRRIGLVPDSTTARWEFDPARLEKAVFTVDDHDDPVATMQRLCAERDPSLPIWVGVSDRYLYVFLGHGVGDGWLTFALSASLAGAPDEPAPWQRPEPFRHPLATALAGALKHNPTLPFTTATRLLHNRRDARRGSSTPRPASEHVAWEPSYAVQSARGGPDAMAELARWRDRSAPGISTTVLLFAARVRALREQGLDPVNTINLLVDVRRFLSMGALVTSNFAAGVPISLRDAGDPFELSAAVKEATGGGRAAITLAATAASIEGAIRRQRFTPDPTSAPRDPRPRLTFTDMGRAEALGVLPWDAEPAARRYIAMVTPAGPEDLVIGSGRLVGGCMDSVSFHGNVFASDTLRQALQAVANDPVRLLTLS